jgi:hypothetical protein
MPQWWNHYLSRHQHPASRILHLIGVPMTIAAAVLAMLAIEGSTQNVWVALILVLVGFLLQWIGHLIEGNDMGELILIKKWMGLPYRRISPRYQKQQENHNRS